MNSLIFVNSTDITPYINWKTYKSSHEKMYESWKDGNYVEHRIFIRERLLVSFDVWLCGINDMDTDAFFELWNGAVNNYIITLGVYDQLTNSIQAINAYYNITPSDHKEMMNGNYFDVFHIEVTER